MKYLFINSVYGVRSTGKIIAQQCRQLQAQGHTCLVGYGRETTPDSNVKTIKIGNQWDVLFHGFLSLFFDAQGFGSKKATRQFLKQVEAYAPDVIWLHNLHGYYIHLETLFNWLKAHPKVKVFWTLHDCWAFTGHCAYFTVAKCDKWKTQCMCCPQKQAYPRCLGVTRSKTNYTKKKEIFNGVTDLTLITPSKWLADLTRASFLKGYPVVVKNNEIDTTVFKPTPSDFRQKHGLQNKKIVLGVAVGWEDTKGLPDMLKLAQLLDDRFVVVLVGVTQKQIQKLPPNVLGIARTQNQQELAAIYTAADVFVNPTHQDNYPTVNLEARACGAPVITYDVGGSPESAGGEYIIPENDVKKIAESIAQIVAKHSDKIKVGNEND